MYVSVFSVSAQKGDKVISSQKGSKPKWVKKSEEGVRFVGKSESGFRGKKQSGYSKAKDSYFFVANAEAKNPPYEKDDVKDLARLRAGNQLASSICSQLSASVEEATTITDENRAAGLNRLTTLSTKAKFSGFLLKKEYWELVVRAKEKYYKVYLLYVIDEEKVTGLIEKVADKVGVPNDISANAQEQLDNSLDEGNLGEIDLDN